jgi:hypothetical protein
MSYHSTSNYSPSPRTNTTSTTGPAVVVTQTAADPGNVVAPLDDTVNQQIDDTLALPSISSKTIDRTFGRIDDYIELHIYNNNNQIILSEGNFKDYYLDLQEGQSTTSNIQIDPNKILTDRGFITGQFQIKLNILKNKIFNSTELPFLLKEVSTSRREIKSTAPKLKNNTFDKAVSGFISEIESTVYFKEFSINFGNDILIPCINILLNREPVRHELLLKTLSPLPIDIPIRSSFKVVEEIVDPIIIDIDLGDPELFEEGIPLKGPNFHIDIRQNNSVPSGFKSYDELLSYNVTSSYQHLLSKIENTGLKVDIQYDHIRAVSESLSGVDIPYHFDNFIHFSSATERLNNFKYKLELIELYDSQVSKIGNITGNTSSSSAVVFSKNTINTKKENLIKGFDGYEQFLYFESGTYSWPKQNTSSPYTLYSVSSSQAKTWLGDSRGAYPNYGGQLLSASLFDKQNEYSLEKLIPNFIKENSDNNLYVNFINMIGQHFDTVWTYIKAITETKNATHTQGSISKDLVYYQLKSLGIESFDQFENTNLIEYILGEGTGSNQYDVDNFFSSSGIPSETMITASNAGSIPKQDIAKEIWKRLYHNAPHLLKTKGTERGIKALMSCYGIPSTILNIKEYGGSTPVSGPLKDLKTADFYKTFTYEKASLALKGNSDTGGFFVKTNWSSALADTYFTSAQQEKKTVEFRIKPIRLETNQHLFSLSGSSSDGLNNLPAQDIHLILQPYTGNDISTSGDSTQYGKLELRQGASSIVITSNFPIYNGDFWNIFIHAEDDPSGTDALVSFGAYQANFNKNIHKFTTSSTHPNYKFTWGRNEKGAKQAYFGGVPANPSSNYDLIDGLKYSGSFQEIRYYFGELLSDSTLKKHALEPFMYAGNSVSSSFNNIVLRLPLGSNDQQNSGSFHPNIDVDYLGMIDGVSSSISSQQWEEIIETHFLPTPDTIGISTTSEKIRIDEGTVNENILSPFKKLETSTLDRQPQDFEDLGIFFSPTNEINEDIVYTLGSFRLDDFIGSPLPSEQTSSFYTDLKNIKDVYFQKVKRKYGYGDYIKIIQYLDHTLFKLIEQFVPFRSNLKTGLVIEPHFLERSKFQRTLPVRSDAQTAIPGTHQNIETNINLNYFSGSIYSLNDSNVVSIDNLSFTTSSKGKRLDKGTNGTIHIYDDHLNPFLRDKNAENNQAAQAPIVPFFQTKPFGYISHESSILLGNAPVGRKSKKYYKYNEYILQ